MVPNPQLTHSLLRTSRTFPELPSTTIIGKKAEGSRTTDSQPHRARPSYQLVLAAVQVMAVVEDIFICWVQTGLHTIFYYLAGSWRALKFLHLPINLKKYGSRVLLTWVRSLPRSAPKLSQIPSSFSRSRALPWDETVRTADGENYLVHPSWSMIFLEVTQELMYGNMGLEVMDPIALDYTQWFLASMSLGPGPQPSTPAQIHLLPSFGRK